MDEREVEMSILNKSTPLLTDRVGQELPYYSAKHDKTLHPVIVREKRGYVWLDFGKNDVRRVCKYRRISPIKN